MRRPELGRQPLFSVVIPAYRAESTIAEAIESALGQSRPAEVIVVDDASPDGQWDVIRGYGSEVTAIRLQENGGEAVAKNAGVRAATGKYVVTLDADDVWLLDRLAAMAERCAAPHQPTLVTTDAWIETPLGPRRRYYETLSWPSGDLRTAIIRKNFIFSHAAVLRDQWLAAGGMNERRRDACGDWPLWVKLILGGAAAELVDEPLARYRIFDSSLSASALCLARTREVAMRTALGCGGTTKEERRLARSSLSEALTGVRTIQTFGALYEGKTDRWAALRLAARHGIDRDLRIRAAKSLVVPWRVRRGVVEDPRIAIRA